MRRKRPRVTQRDPGTPVPRGPMAGVLTQPRGYAVPVRREFPCRGPTRGAEGRVLPRTRIRGKERRSGSHKNLGFWLLPPKPEGLASAGPPCCAGTCAPRLPAPRSPPHWAQTPPGFSQGVWDPCWVARCPPHKVPRPRVANNRRASRRLGLKRTSKAARLQSPPSQLKGGPAERGVEESAGTLGAGQAALGCEGSLAPRERAAPGRSPSPTPLSRKGLSQLGHQRGPARRTHPRARPWGAARVACGDRLRRPRSFPGSQATSASVCSQTRTSRPGNFSRKGRDSAWPVVTETLGRNQPCPPRGHRRDTGRSSSTQGFRAEPGRF